MAYGDSLLVDLAATFEHWGEPDRLGLPARDLARFTIANLENVRPLLLAVRPAVEEATLDDARPTRSDEGTA